MKVPLLYWNIYVTVGHGVYIMVRKPYPPFRIGYILSPLEFFYFLHIIFSCLAPFLRTLSFTSLFWVSPHPPMSSAKILSLVGGGGAAIFSGNFINYNFLSSGMLEEARPLLEKLGKMSGLVFKIESH